MELDHLRNWIGRTEHRNDDLCATPLAAMSATLDRLDPPVVVGTPIPPLWHWAYFVPVAPHSEIGEDGHPRRGGFLPPVPLPRRMWAGGRLEFRRPMRIGTSTNRASTIKDVRVKSGRSGHLVFVTVAHEFSDPSGVLLVEEHDIVYRDAPAPGAPPAGEPVAAPRDEQFSRAIVADPVLLFRYSALTFNGHRIHYDRSYVTEVEGYPGLIVHGPLIATLLLDLLRRQRPDAAVARFSFRALRPVFDIHPFEVCGKMSGPKQATLWTRDHEGAITMEASADLD